MCFLFFMHKHLRWLRQQISLATGGLSAIWAAGHENMWLYGCPYNGGRDEKSTLLEKTSHSGPSKSKTAMRKPISWLAYLQLQTKFWPNECFWCKGLRRPTGSWEEFEDLCIIILSALFFFCLFFTTTPLLKGDALLGLQLSSNTLSREWVSSCRHGL